MCRHIPTVVTRSHGKNSFLRNVDLFNIVKKLLPLFVHTAWKELKYRKVWQLRALARRNFQGNKTASM